MKQKIILLAILFLISMSNLNAQKLKGDPWIFNAYQELYQRQPSAWELNIKNYNSGSWNNYDELRKYVKMYQISLRNSNLTVSTTILKSGNVIALFNQNGRSIAANLISQDGGGIIASGGGNIIASGGGNIVASGGGNIVASGGGNFAALKGVFFGSKYSTLSVGTTIIPASGNGALIIR